MSQIGFWIIAVANYLIPKRRQIVLHSFPDVEDQLVSLLRWLADHGDLKCPVIVLISGNELDVRRRLNLLVGKYAGNLVVLNKKTLVAVWKYCRSRYVFITHGLYGFCPTPRRQCVVNLWHGMPLKAIWKSAPGSKVPDCRWLLSTSDSFSEVLSSVSGIPVDRIKPFGLPRNDLLFSTTAAIAAFNDELLADEIEHLVVYLPTYRKSVVGYSTTDGVETGSALLMDANELSELRELLGSTRTRLLVKPHPMSIHCGKVSLDDHFVWIVSDDWLHDRGVTLYEVLGRSDVLVSDVSSVIVDYLSLKKPVLIYFPDFEKYEHTRRFLLTPIEEYLPSGICSNFKELLGSLSAILSGNDVHLNRRRRLAELLNPHDSPVSTQRLMEFCIFSR